MQIRNPNSAALSNSNRTIPLPPKLHWKLQWPFLLTTTETCYCCYIIACMFRHGQSIRCLGRGPRFVIVFHATMYRQTRNLATLTWCLLARFAPVTRLQHFLTCLKEEGNLFQHLLEPGYLNIYWGTCSRSYVYIVTLLPDSWVLIRSFVLGDHPV
jgi:hypothetical protein